MARAALWCICPTRRLRAKRPTPRTPPPLSARTAAFPCQRQARSFSPSTGRRGPARAAWALAAWTTLSHGSLRPTWGYRSIRAYCCPGPRARCSAAMKTRSRHWASASSSPCPRRWKIFLKTPWPRFFTARTKRAVLRVRHWGCVATGWAATWLLGPGAITRASILPPPEARAT